MRPERNPKHAKRRPDPLAALVLDLAREAARPVTATGGWGARLRRQQALMLRAAELLAHWRRRPPAPEGQGSLLEEG